MLSFTIFFFQAEDGIRDGHVTGVQTCALPISSGDQLFLFIFYYKDFIVAMALNVSALFTPKGIQELMFQAKGVAELVPALVNSGIVGAHGLKATAVMPANLARYRLTTARELEQGYATCPERIALIAANGAISYRQLRDDSQTVANYLRTLGLDEIRMGVMARNGRGIVTPMAAKGYAGASIYLLNVSSSKEQLAGSIKECGINALVIDDEFAGRMPTEHRKSTRLNSSHVAIS